MYCMLYSSSYRITLYALFKHTLQLEIVCASFFSVWYPFLSASFSLALSFLMTVCQCNHMSSVTFLQVIAALCVSRLAPLPNDNDGVETEYARAYKSTSPSPFVIYVRVATTRESQLRLCNGKREENYGEKHSCLFVILKYD